MSIVAWDGKTLAADRQVTNQGLRRTVSKIRRLSDGTLLAWVGPLAEGLVVARWYEEGCDLDRWPESQQDKDDWAALIIVKTDGTVWMYERWGEAIEVLDPQMAWGSGRDFAVGAMAMGADARKAVEIASEFSTECGMGVEAFDVGLELVKTGD